MNIKLYLSKSTKIKRQIIYQSAFDYYGTVKLNDNELIIKTLKEDKVITTEPYNYLKHSSINLIGK